MKVNHLERWLRLVFGVIVLLFAGIIYAWTILKAPFASEFGWDPAQLSLNYTLTIVSFCIGGFFAGLLTKRTTPRFRILVSAALLFAGFFGTSRLNPEGGIIWLYVCYGMASGFGVGFAYTTVIGLTNAWFPDKKGLCSGILLMGFGLTSLVIGNIADALMKDPDVGWRAVYLGLAISLGAVLLLASFIIRAPAEGTVFPEPKSAKRSEQKSTMKSGQKGPVFRYFAYGVWSDVARHWKYSGRADEGSRRGLARCVPGSGDRLGRGAALGFFHYPRAG
jgi:OFA family oxalate/formate antiporter-like MFS transporter